MERESFEPGAPKSILNRERGSKKKKKLSWGNVKVRVMSSHNEYDQELQNFSYSGDEGESEADASGKVGLIAGDQYAVDRRTQCTS